MSDKLKSSIHQCFEDLPDLRMVGRCDRNLMDMIIIAVCAVISWVGIETYGEVK